MSDHLIKRKDVLVVLRKAQTASCTCQVKTPDPDWHNHNCRYRILREVEAMIDHLPDAALPAVTLPDDVAKVVEEAGRYPEILLGYSQGDMEGVMALISRQALHEAADTIRALTAIITAQAAQIVKMDRAINGTIDLLERAKVDIDANKARAEAAETALAAMTSERDDLKSSVETLSGHIRYKHELMQKDAKTLAAEREKVAALEWFAEVSAEQAMSAKARAAITEAGQ